MTTVTTYTSSTYKEFVFDSPRTCEYCGSHFTAVCRTYVTARASSSRSPGHIFNTPHAVAEKMSQVLAEQALLKRYKDIAMEQPYLPHRCTNCGCYGSRDIDAFREAITNPERKGVPEDKNASYGGVTYGKGGVIGTGYPRSLRKRRMEGIPRVILGAPILSVFALGLLGILYLRPWALDLKAPPEPDTAIQILMWGIIAMTTLSVFWYCIKAWWPPSMRRVNQRLADCNHPKICAEWLKYWQNKAPHLLSILDIINTEDSESFRRKRINAWRRLIRCQRKFDP